MGLFPNLSNIDPAIDKRLRQLAKSNVETSALIPWIRITSGADLVIESLPSGSNSFGNVYGNNSHSGRVGTTWAGTSVFEDSATAARGYRPSPTIDALSVENGHKGLTRKCSFSIKCYSLPQAEKVSQYFLEPGYTCLVEIGWNLPQSVQEQIRLTACNIASMNNFGETQRKRKASGGTYDVFLGYQTGGGMKSADAETYVLTVELTTLGEIPAYLQTHKTGVTEKGRLGTTAAFSSNDIEDASDASEVGRTLFMQMFNRLPTQKQTSKIKGLINGVDPISGIKWSDSSNFINMDDEIREKLTEDLTNTSVRSSSDKSAEIPEGVALISEHSFIRLGLAFEILNKYVVNIDAVPVCSGNVKSYDFKIDTTTCVCRGFKHIFSTDPSVLFIPNANTPDFGLIDVLTSTTVKESFFDFDTIDQVKISDGTKLTDEKFRFPQIEPYTKTDTTLDQIPVDSPAHTWGYLRDLYINMDFFIEVMDKTNYVAKDVYYEILNGISSAVNSYWYFEIVEVPDKDGDMHLEIKDFSFTGDMSKIDSTSKFRASGTDSVFLESELSLDIPGAMKNSILGQRSSTKVSGQVEGQDTTRGSIFNGKNDKVLEILNSFKDSEEAAVVSNEPKSDDDSDKNRKANYDIFMGKAGVLPTVKDRTAAKDVVDGWGPDLNPFNNKNIEEILFVGSWNDPALLKQLEVKNPDAQLVNNILLPIEFNFTCHGIAGFKVGDLFKIIDLPSQFTKSVFQIIEVGHDIDQSSWKTKVKSQLRNTT